MQTAGFFYQGTVDSLCPEPYPTKIGVLQSLEELTPSPDIHNLCDLMQFWAKVRTTEVKKMNKVKKRKEKKKLKTSCVCVRVCVRVHA